MEDGIGRMVTRKRTHPYRTESGGDIFNDERHYYEDGAGDSHGIHCDYRHDGKNGGGWRQDGGG